MMMAVDSLNVNLDESTPTDTLLNFLEGGSPRCWLRPVCLCAWVSLLGYWVDSYHRENHRFNMDQPALGVQRATHSNMSQKPSLLFSFPSMSPGTHVEIYGSVSNMALRELCAPRASWGCAEEPRSFPVSAKVFKFHVPRKDSVVTWSHQVISSLKALDLLTLVWGWFLGVKRFGDTSDGCWQSWGVPAGSLKETVQQDLWRKQSNEVNWVIKGLGSLENIWPLPLKCLGDFSRTRVEKDKANYWILLNVPGGWWIAIGHSGHPLLGLGAGGSHSWSNSLIKSTSGGRPSF